MTTNIKILIDKLASPVKHSLEKAAELCVQKTNFTVELEHFLYKLLEIQDGDWHQVLRYYDIPETQVRRDLETSIDALKRGNTSTPALSPHILTLLEEAWVLSSLSFGAGAIRSGVLLLTLLESKALHGLLTNFAPSLLELPTGRYQEDIKELLKNTSEDKISIVPVEPNTTLKSAPQEALKQFTIDLTAQAESGKLDPVCGREGEINQLIDVLLRRRQNNPILVGDAGVGKTAIVEGLALRIIKKQVPESLQNIRLYILDLGLLEAGAGIKGEFENRLKTVMQEVKASPWPVILFIDEAHTMIGVGGAAGSNDAANLLKPALARGELRTIAATTWGEYKRYFEKDPALTRRFQLIQVLEPNQDDAIQMLRGVAPQLESHHGVKILEEALNTAVRLTDRYIIGRKLPDKAVNVLDTACARVAIAQTTEPEQLQGMAYRLNQLALEEQRLRAEPAVNSGREQRLAEISQEKSKLLLDQERVLAQWHQEKEHVAQIHQLDATDQKGQQEALKRFKQLRSEHEGGGLIPLWVDETEVAKIIASWTGIPVGEMRQDEIDKVLNLQSNLERRVIGQKTALEAVAKRIQTYRAGLDAPEKPVGVFLLVGPSGVGKTETALSVAEVMYGGEQNLITLNMSEYQEAYSVSQLKGSPPGYVGHGKGGVLTEAVRRNPYSVLLLDEIEKAHKDVLELFYQVFDKGTLEDSEGVIVDFKNTLIFMTSNAGSEFLLESSGKLAGNGLQEGLRPYLLPHFPAALLGRMTIVPYFSLGSSELEQVTILKLNKIAQRFKQRHKAMLTWDVQVLGEIIKRCNDVASGARTIDHILNHYLLNQISTGILERLARGKSFAHVNLSWNQQVNEFECVFD